jgi:disulfide bond formation protein DsbB
MRRLLDFLLAMGTRWQAWAAVIAIGVGLEAGALYYQQALMYFPCELCIYTRVWLAGIALLAIVGLLVRRHVWPLRAVLAGELLLTMGLAGVVWKLLAIDYGFAGDGTCSLQARFPSWAPLDTWLPVMFRVQDTCGPTPEVLFGLTMGDGLAGVTAGFLLAFGAALFGTFLGASD